MAQMTSRERLLTAMRLGVPDRVPIQVRGVMAWDDHWVETRHESYGPVIEVVREYGDYAVAWGPPSGPFLTMASVEADHERVERADWTETITTMHTPGGDLRTRHLSSKRGLPGLQTEFAVKTPEDVEKVLSVPYMPPEQIDASGFEAQKEAIGERGVVMASIGNDPIGHVHNLVGSERLAIWSVRRRRIIDRLIDVYLRRTLDRIDAMIAAGLGPVFCILGQEYVTPPLHSPADFRDFVVRPERQILNRLHDADRILHVHCHGPLSAVLEDFVQIADITHPIEAPPLGDVPLAEAKRRIGEEICLEGNIQIGDIYALRTDRLVETVKRAIDDAADGGGYILAPTASPHTEILTERTVRNYVAMVETAVEYGG